MTKIAQPLAVPTDLPTPPGGLDEAEAARRLIAHGANELPRPGTRSFAAILLGVLREPMFLLLLVAAALYLALGDPHEGAALGFFACVSVGLVVFQELRGERALDALRDLSAPTARIRRDGRDQTIPARDVVPGDLLLLDEGDRIAADAVVIENHELVVDESILTGESLPVRKIVGRRADAFADARGGGDDRPELFAATLVASGRAVAEVARTGPQTAVGAIGLSLAAIDESATTLEASISGLIRLFGLFGAAASLSLVVLLGTRDGDWIAALLAGLALAMAMLPEEFPMALAILVAFGARRLARIDVLTRRPAVIETLGATSALCVDKTGTLTENRLRLAAVVAPDGAVARIAPSAPPLEGPFAAIAAIARAASRRDGRDPIDRAIAEAAPEGDVDAAELIREYPLTPQCLAVTRLWHRPDGKALVAAKGAPEAIARFCRFDAAASAELASRIEALAADGLRLLAVAEADWNGAPPDDPTVFAFRFVGLVGFADPLRDGVASAVAEARAAGIRVVMITGDYPATALAVARSAGLDIAAGAITGPEIAALDDAALARRIGATTVFARVMPGEKLRIVQALRAGGAVVAMTGDGVNDAPALRAAEVGLAIGPRATDVAKEAADIVLLDENFGHIVAGIRLGRRIFDNLRKVMVYIVAIHIPIAGIALLPVLFGGPPLLLPLHVVLTEMVIDPVCSLAFEAEGDEPGLMQRPPRNVHEPLIGTRQILWGLAQGIGLLTACLGLHVLMRRSGASEDLSRTLVFIALTAGNLALVQVNASLGPALFRLLRPGNGMSLVIAVLAGLALTAAIHVPALAALFHFTDPTIGQTLAAVATGLAAPLLFDLSKLLFGASLPGRM